MVCSVWIIGLGKKAKISTKFNLKCQISATEPAIFTQSSSFSMTKDILQKKTWKVTANFLIEDFQNYAENRKVLLTLDHLASHLDVETLEKLLVNGINTFFFSAGTTFAL